MTFRFLQRARIARAPSLATALATATAALVASLASSGCQKKAPPLDSAGARIFDVGKPAAPRTLVAAGFGTCAKRSDGIWCWGAIGDGASHARPTRLPLTDATAIALGDSHYCVLTTSRHVQCAGRDLDGELGDGAFVNRTQLAPVRGLADVEQIAAGSFKTCAIIEVKSAPDADGGSSKHQVYCFGTDEGAGRQGTAARRSEPVRIGAIDDALELTVDWGLACVRRGDGSVWCWGDNDKGQLGNGVGGGVFGKRALPTSDPVRVLHLADAVGISAGGFAACALTARGTVGCWGENSYGRLGDGTSTSRGDPSNVAGLSDVAEVASGGFGHACARRRDGAVFCWGFRIGAPERSALAPKGQLSPARVPSLDDATEIAAGHTHTCARRKNGSIVCWGDNSEGQLGDGTTAPSEIPHEVLGPE